VAARRRGGVVKEKEARDEFVRQLVSYFAHPSGSRLEGLAHCIRDSFQTGALNDTEAEAAMRALKAREEYRVRLVRYGT
jgi:hypothetical protein